MMKHNFTMGNGLPVWNERAIVRRRAIEEELAAVFRDVWRERVGDKAMMRVETSPLVYDGDLEIYGKGADKATSSHSCVCTDLVDISLRNETTFGTFMAAKHFMNQGQKLPFCVWQSGMSFREEQDFTAKHKRYHAFYQQEFQVLYRKPDNDELDAVLFLDILQKLGDAFPKFNRIMVDVAPPYSAITFDFEIDGIEVASCSLRKDYPFQQIGSGKGIWVAEYAFGLDRLVELL